MMRVAVIGAGMQGVCTALELTLRGVAVDLYEAEEEVLTRASLRNEGKVHLGFVFANDTSFATAALMAEGAFVFGPLLKRWLGAALPQSQLASPFYYFVRRDSLVSPEELEARYRRITALIAAQAGRAGADYFGDANPVLAERLDLRAQRVLVDETEIAAVFRTSEIAVDPEGVAQLLRARIASDPRIRLRLRTKVLAAAVDTRQVAIRCVSAGQEETLPYDHVVNASWEGRLAIDAASSIALPADWSFRAKYFLRLRAARNAQSVPSATIVLGPYGDIVRYANGDLFLSWYPAGRTAMSSDIAPPYWPSLAPEPQATTIRQGIRDALLRMVPALRELADDALVGAEVHGGPIFALGRTDISDPASGLHQRWDVGPRSTGRYHTVDTGKYSVAPLFALRVADRIVAA